MAIAAAAAPAADKPPPVPLRAQGKVFALDDAPKAIKHIQFGVMSQSEIVALSEFEATRPDLYRGSETREPTPGGVLDRRLGVTDKTSDCETCGCKTIDCSGHMAFIRLVLPVFHIGYFKQTITILQDICKSCARCLLTEEDRRKYLPRFRKPHLENMARQRLAKEVNTLCRKAIFCPHCGAVNGSVKKSGPLRIEHDKFRAKKTAGEKADWEATFGSAVRDNRELGNLVPKSKEDMNALRVITLFRRISAADCELLGLAPEVCRPEEFIWTYIPVPPVCIRPSVAQDNATNEDDLTVKLAEIVKLNTLIRASLDHGEPTTKIMEIWDFLQLTVAMYINSETPGLPASGARPIRAFCQRLKGKQGRFRGNLSGKRVDFSGRTVISPDPNLRIDEVAVPERVAKILTYPERVTALSLPRLQQAIRNGQDIHPGANYWSGIAMANGVLGPTKRALKHVKPAARKALADGLKIGDLIDRHLVDGDVVLFNRQPSLHKLSIMSHFVKVRPSRTFRFNECVCTPYNADFDGDEMNLHVPQTEEARTEAAQLMNIRQNLVTPRNGEPIIAATQDFITGAYLLSRKDEFLDRQQFCQVLSFLDDAKTHYDLPPPTIHKPQQLWTGKQIFNLLMRPNAQSKVTVNLETRCRTANLDPKLSHLADEVKADDGFLVIRNSEIMAGVMDKSTVGDGRKNSVFGIILRDFGANEAAAAMNRLAKLSNRGFSIGVGDVMPGLRLREQKEALVKKAYEAADELIYQLQTGSLENDPGCNPDQTLEAHIIGSLSRVREQCGDICVSELSRHNAPLIMANCGSKGSKINVSQMVACVGQQVISGSRVPDGFVDRSLPHFPKSSKKPDAKGFVVNSFFSGLTATEFLFHAVSGREGLVDTAVKTAETGYMQRRLMKALEDLSIRYDTSVRNSTGGVVQFKYGDDGLDPTYLEGAIVPVDFKRTWLHAKALYLLADEVGILPVEIIERAKARVTEADFDLVEQQLKDALVDFVKDELAGRLATCRLQYELPACLKQDEADAYDDANAEGERDTDERNKPVEDRQADKAKRIKIVRNKMEVKAAQLNGFLELCRTKFIGARIEPGTAVGAVGAQSIGEPGTQMTLKTFHFAGVASMNITLGVPRIREIINASKVIATPIVTAQLENTSSEAAARIVKARIEKTYLRDVAEIVAPVYAGESSYVSVHINRRVLGSLGLHDLTVDDVKEAIKASSKLKIDNITVLPKQNRLRVFPLSDEAELKKGNKPHDDFTRLLDLARRLPDTVIRGIKECSRAVIKKVEVKKGQPEQLQMLVEGNGFRDVMTTEGVVGVKTVSNHIMEVEKVLGIEAARQTVIHQIGFTMSSHGLTVDPRHQMLLGDLMSFKGEVLGINRFGVAKLKDSVLMLASFEKTTDHLFEGAFYAKRDSVHGISERIILGQSASHLGTSMASLVLRKPKLQPPRGFLLTF